MKNLLLLLLLLFSFSGIKSQSSLTWGEIYDFDIGDILITESSPQNGPPGYVKYEFTSKSFSAALDTVYYTTDKFTYVGASCQNCEAYYDTTYGYTRTFANLNDTIGTNLGVEPIYLSPECIDSTGFTGKWLDSIYSASSQCNRLVAKIDRMGNTFLSDSCFSCFEPYYGYDIYGKGLGMVKHYYNTCATGGSNCIENGKLVYYQKGQESCGSIPNIVLGVNDAHASNHMSIYPNPLTSQSTITFRDFLSNAQISLIDMHGREMKSLNFTGDIFILEKGNLKNGLYLISVKSEQFNSVLKLVVQ